MVRFKFPLRDPRGLEPEEFKEIEDSLYVQVEDELFGEDWLDSYATTILDATYGKADILAVANNQHKQFHIELEPDHTPVHAQIYPVPRVHLEVFRRELNHLVKLEVLESQGLSRWTSPSFIIPKMIVLYVG